jgi:hypothetical protein
MPYVGCSEVSKAMSMLGHWSSLRSPEIKGSVFELAYHATLIFQRLGTSSKSDGANRQNLGRAERDGIG